jgi:tRNA(fMet)-specific endonuclease VapC
MSLFLLDTDTLSLLQHNHPQVVQHVASVPPTDMAITIITVEEQLTGWYSALRKARQPDEIARVYLRLTNAIRSFMGLPILTFTESAVNRYLTLVGLRLNIGKMDLRIAAIALEHGATVVTRNTRDFGRVPHLTVVDWSV